MLHRWFVKSCLVLVAAGLSTNAFAAEKFGERGQIVPLGSIGFSSSTDTPPSSAGAGAKSSTTTNLSLGPGLRYFVIDNLAIGLTLLYINSSTKTDGASETSDMTAVGAAPVIAYNIGLGESVSLLPELSLAYKSADNGKSGDKEFKLKNTTLGVYVPVLWHAAPHIFLGVGPSFNTDLAASQTALGKEEDTDKTTAWGLKSVIGGWF